MSVRQSHCLSNVVRIENDDAQCVVLSTAVVVDKCLEHHQSFTTESQTLLLTALVYLLSREAIKRHSPARYTRSQSHAAHTLPRCLLVSGKKYACSSLHDVFLFLEKNTLALAYSTAL